MKYARCRSNFLEKASELYKLAYNFHLKSLRIPNIIKGGLLIKLSWEHTRRLVSIIGAKSKKKTKMISVTSGKCMVKGLLSVSGAIMVSTKLKSPKDMERTLRKASCGDWNALSVGDISRGSVLFISLLYKYS